MPTPLSPAMTTVALLAAMRATESHRACMAGSRVMMRLKRKPSDSSCFRMPISRCISRICQARFTSRLISARSKGLMTKSNTPLLMACTAVSRSA